MWTEYISDELTVEYMLLPRLLKLSCTDQPDIQFPCEASLLPSCV